jgi:hypothetical protein
MISDLKRKTLPAIAKAVGLDNEQGESSGHLTFPVQAMSEVSGRLILGAMEMLLSAYRVFTAPPGRRLKDVLEESRKYQAESTTLASQVVDARWELLRGFQMADAATNGRLLGELATQNPQHIYIPVSFWWA